MGNCSLSRPVEVDVHLADRALRVRAGVVTPLHPGGCRMLRAGEVIALIRADDEERVGGSDAVVLADV